MRVLIGQSHRTAFIFHSDQVLDAIGDDRFALFLCFLFGDLVSFKIELTDIKVQPFRYPYPDDFFLCWKPGVEIFRCEVLGVEVFFFGFHTGHITITGETDIKVLDPAVIGKHIAGTG